MSLLSRFRFKFVRMLCGAVFCVSMLGRDGPFILAEVQFLPVIVVVTPKFELLLLRLPFALGVLFGGVSGIEFGSVDKDEE